MAVRSPGAVITTGIVQIVAPSSAPRPGLREEIEQLVNDELDAFRRQVIADHGLDPDA